MAESKFLKYQDLDGDRIPDVCDDELEIVEEIRKCPTCTPNPYATTVDWKTQNSTSPVFNEKTCTFELTITTPYSETIDLSLFPGVSSYEQLTDAQVEEGMAARYDEFKDQAAEAYLIENNKDSSPEAIEQLKESINNLDYDLDPRPASKLKLLYGVDFEDLAIMPDDPLDNEEEDDSEDPEEDSQDGTNTTSTVTYQVDELRPKIVRVRKGLRLYSKYLKVFRAIKKGNILFTDNNAVFNLQKYGDSGTFNNTTLGSILFYINAFLNKRNLNIPMVGPIKPFADRVTKIEIDFASDYKITTMRVYVAGCGNAPKIFGRRKLKSLIQNINKGVFRDSTAMAYFAQLDEMDNALQAREPGAWIEFIKQFTYPEVYDKISSVNDQEASTSSCVSNVLANETKQLGQDILDDSFSIGDAVVWAFRDKVCLDDPEEYDKFIQELGMAYDTSDENVEAGLTGAELRGEDRYSRQTARLGRLGNLRDMAREQAYQTLQQNDTVLTLLCEKMLKVTGESDHSSFNLSDLFEGNLDNIKACGIFNLLSESISCLLKNLTFEQAIGAIVRSALNAMSIDNLENLFFLLPADKRDDINALAMEKISSGDVFGNQSVNQSMSDEIQRDAPNSPTLESYAQMRRDAQATGRESESQAAASQGDQNSVGGGATRPRNNTSLPMSSPNSRTLAQSLDPGTNDFRTLGEDTLISAYASAIVETYGDDVIDVIDLLNKYPGAQIIKRTLVYFDCPTEPMMDPSIADFIKSVQLPICRSTHDIVMPKLVNPFGWLPDVYDWQAKSIELGKLAIRQAIVHAIVKLIIKVCEILSGTMCTTLQTTGDLIASLPTLSTGRENFKDFLRQNLCGDDATDGDLEDAIDDLLNGFGGPPNKFVSEDDLKDFVTDYTNSLTQSELTSLTMGEATPDSLNIATVMLETEHQNVRDTFPDREAIANFFANVGNILPADVRGALQDSMENPLDPSPELGTGIPVNPTICATQEQYEDFCNFRASLLSGRATPEQIAQMCENQRNDYLDDLDDLSDIAQSGMPVYLDSNLPPLFSEPGCDDGLFPHESPEAILAAQNVISGEFEKLQVAYSKDMIGNGPFQRNFGMLNMILSDTMGNPLTTHHRKTFLQKDHVDFYRDGADDEFGKVSRIESQRAAYPQKVAEWLQYQMAGTNDVNDLQNSIDFSYNNNFKEKKTVDVNVSNLNIPLPVKYYNFPNFGFDVDFNLDINKYDDLILSIETHGRKENSDLKLSFKDNARGLRTGDNEKSSAYAYGFDIHCYFSELRKDEPLRQRETLPPVSSTNDISLNLSNPESGIERIVNVPSDNVRIVVSEILNEGARKVSNLAPFTKRVMKPKGDPNDEESAIFTRKYEMFCTEDTLNNFDFSQYPEFERCFIHKSDVSPPIILLKAICNSNSWTRTLSTDDSKAFVDSATNTIIKKIFKDISNNDVAFNYGAKFDSLTDEDLEYVLGPGYGVYSGGPYGDALIEDTETGEMRKIINDDMILGMSRMQYEIEESNTYSGTSTENRVFYLDPMSYGRNYMSPAIYIKPEQNKGWLGLIDVLFPEINPCKPQVADFVDFGEISDIMSNKYSTIPEDIRIESGGQDCVVELPYNRILDRSSAACLEGLIIGTVRIFCSVHLLKAFATFSKFKPSFPDVFSSVYAHHIVEEIEESLSDAQTSFEFITAFKDEEFCLAFLEQAVQMYGRKIDSGEILDPPSHVLSSIIEINDLQSKYVYPSKADLKEAKDSGLVPRTKLLKNYREDEKYNFIFKTKHLAKVVLKQIVVEELNKLGDRLANNMQAIDVKPDIVKISNYFFENFVQGHTLSLMGNEFTETPESLPTEQAEDLYTSGGELVVYDVRDQNSNLNVGDEYVGYYHIHVDDSGTPIYMEGEFHRDTPHNVLKPYADKLIISNSNTGLPLGDIDDWSTGNEGDVTIEDEKPFLIEKYISINEQIYAPQDAVDIILANEDTSQNLSDVYPGTLEQVLDDNENVIGLTGHLGVRYGLVFSIILGGKKFLVMKTEIDALDFEISKFAPLEANSKLLLCLYNQLVDDQKFQIVMKYIFNVTKSLSIAAIYNDLGFIPSIGEVTVDDGEAYGSESSIDNKPGSSVVIELDSDDEIVSVEEKGKEGWASVDNRTPGFLAGLFVNEWDKWDRILLRNSKRKIKKMFNIYYRHGFEFSPGDLGDLPRPGQLLVSNLRNAMKPKPGLQLLPWWKLRSLRTNPFDSKGNICENE